MPQRSLPAFALVVLLAILAISFATLAQGFGEPDSTFGSSGSDRTFETSPPPAPGTSGAGPDYFVHDQLTKFLLVLGFTAAGLAIVLLRRFRLRRWLLLASVAVLGFLIGGMLCPISAVQNVILKISTGYLLLFLVPTVTALFAGRLFCGYVCPFGALQELLHVRKLRLWIPERWMRVLRFLPYAVLAYLVARVLATGVLTWDGATPFKAFFTLGGTPLTLGISALFVLLSVFVFRPFCRLFCPLGAWLSLVSRVSPFHIRVGSSCVSCGKCDAVCSCGAIDRGRTSRGDCLLCGECIRACPVGTLRFSGKRPPKAL
jgi:polyferredoxin